MIEVREERASASKSSALIRCSHPGGAAALVRCVDLALDLGHSRLVVDLGERRDVDADLLDALHRSGRRMRDTGGRLAVVCADSRLRRLFDFTLLGQGLDVYETREEALAS